MKTKLFHAGRSTLSVVLAVMMLLSTMLMGSLSTVTAATVDDSEEVGVSDTFTANSTLYIDVGSTWGNLYPDTNTPYVTFAYQSYNMDSSELIESRALTYVSGTIFTTTVPNNDYVRAMRVERRSTESTSTTWDSVTTTASARTSDSDNLFTISSWSTNEGWSTYSASTTTDVANNVSLAASPTSPEAGSNITLTATATLADGVESATYTFCDGDDQLGTSTDGTYTVSSITAGSHTYKVTISADGYNSVSATTTVNATSSSSSTPHIYLADSASWGSAYAYAWNGSTVYTDSWPGSAMTLDSTYTTSKGVNVYAYELDSSATGNIIFVKENNGSQTTNLTLPSDWTTTDYIYDNSKGKWSTLADYVYTDTTTYDYYIIGNDFGGKWTTDYKDYGMTKQENNNYYISAYLTQNSSYFRFHNGTTYYGAQGKDTGITASDSLQVTENGENSWKFTGESGQYKIHFGGASNLYVWLEADDTTISGDIFMSSNVDSFNDATAVGATATKNDDGTITYTKTYTVGTSGDLQAGEYLFGFTATGNLTNLYGSGTIDQSGQISGDIDVNSQYAKLTGRDSDPQGMKVTLSEDATLLTVTVTKATDGSITYYATGTATASAKLIAKNGTIRTSGGNYDSITDDMGTTTVSYNYTYITDGVTISDGTARKVVKMSTEAIKKGLDLTITTTMNSGYSDKYYVAGWVVNGETYGLQEDTIEVGGTGAETTVSFDYTVPVDTTVNDVIEVTPVYYMKSTSTVRFYVEDYENVKAAWGNTLACYAYYSTGDGAESFNMSNGFGCYPGQPMLQTGGRYFYELPTSITGNDGNTYEICGVTLNNYMWDDVHKSLVGSTNYQTYDYSDFASIYNNIVSKQTKSTDIIFAFKYTAESASGSVDHFGSGNAVSSLTVPSGTSDTDTLGNVTEYLTDFYGDRVDLFHNNIQKKDTVNNNPWIVISNGYEAYTDDSNDIGYYATKWAVYKPSSTTGSCTYSYVTAINSASLFYSSSTDCPESDAYTALVDADAKGQPVKISYEKEITRGFSVQNTSAESGGQEGARSDGVWYYSIADTTVTAHTAVQYAQTYSSTGYSDSDYTTDWYLSTTTSGWDYEDTANYDPDSTEYYKGHTTGLEAYFNFSADDGTNFWHKTAATLSTESTKKFVFYAQPKTYNGKTYQFDGWYLYNASSDTYTLISTEQNYYTDPVNNDLYVARFSPVPTDGALTVNHYFDSANSTGTADVNVKVEVVDADENVQYTNSGTNTATVPQSTGWINSESNNNVVITLTTTPGTGVTFEEFEELVDGVIESLGTSETDLVVKTSSSITYDNSNGTYTATITFPVKSLFNGSTQTISSLTYYSKTSVNFKLQIDYTYDTRYYGTKVYQVISKNYYTSVNSAAETVTLDSDFANEYIVSDGNDGYKVTNDCIINYAPDVSNFNQNISWDVSGATQTYTDGLIKVELTAKQEDNLERTASITVYDENGKESVVAATGTYPKDVSITTDQDLGQTYHFKDSDGESVSTARTYTQDGVTYKFSYWDVKTTNGVAVTKVYPDENGTGDIYFGYSAFDNYTVTAVYNSKVDPKGSITASVQELADTRNQWNNTVSGETDTQSGNKIVYGEYNNATTKYDRLYIDFALAFKVVDSENNVVRLNTTTGYSVGLVVVNANASVTESDIKAAINGTSTNGVIVKSIATSKLTNKNRIEYCLGYSNADAVKDANLTVYSYIVDTDGNVTLSAALTGVDYSDCTADTTD